MLFRRPQEVFYDLVNMVCIEQSASCVEYRAWCMVHATLVALGVCLAGAGVVCVSAHARLPGKYLSKLGGGKYHV